MKWTTREGRSFSLAVTGYQFPEITEDKFDSNWIYVTITLEGFDQPWSSNDPVLLTWELNTLCSWLQSLLMGEQSTDELRFREPNLSFYATQIDADKLTILVSLDLESKPAWWAASEPYSFSMELEKNDLRHSIRILEAQIKEFPYRGNAPF